MRLTHLLGNRWTISLCVPATLCATLAPAPAQGPPPGASLDIALIHQFDTDLDEDDASFRRTRVQSGYRHARSLERGRSAGFGIDYALDRYDFSGAFDDPWETVHRVGFSTTLQGPLAGRWTGMVAPSLDLAGESGASWDQAVKGGGFVAINGRINPRLFLGLGVAAFAGLKDTTVAPVVLVRWQIADRWSLANPFRPGPTGPAGLELSYQPNATWSWGAGSVYRDNRFRLDDEGTARDGIGDVGGIIAFARVSRSWTGGISANLYGAVLLDGELTVEDEEGRRLSQQDFDPAPLAAISMRAPF